MSYGDRMMELNRAALECGMTTNQASEAFAKLAEVANELAEKPGFREWQYKILVERFGKRKARKILKGRK